MDFCQEHSGCLKEIENLKACDKKQWEELGDMRKIHEQIMSKLNIILGGLIVASVGLLLNVVFK